MSRRIVSRYTTVYRTATDKTGRGITEDGSATQIRKIARRLEFKISELQEN